MCPTQGPAIIGTGHANIDLLDLLLADIIENHPALPARIEHEVLMMAETCRPHAGYTPSSGRQVQVFCLSIQLVPALLAANNLQLFKRHFVERKGPDHDNFGAIRLELARTCLTNLAKLPGDAEV
jgi:hypothetical protein